MNPRTARLRAALTQRPLLADGATGTQLQLRGLAPGACGELWNLERPDFVRAVHDAYRAAGAALLTTNSFGGTAPVLAGHGAGHRVLEINLAAAQLARATAGEDAWVLGDIGPFGGMLEPLGDASADEVALAFRAQAAALLEGGADALLIETMSDPEELRLAVQAARAAGADLVFATYTFQAAAGQFHTLMGTTVAEAVAVAREAGADAVGANCGTGLSLDDYARLTAELVAAAAGLPVIVQPNAGAPKLVDGRILYDGSPAEFAAAARRLLELGARIVGGCCGSTPEHIAAMSTHFTP